MSYKTNVNFKFEYITCVYHITHVLYTWSVTCSSQQSPIFLPKAVVSRKCISDSMIFINCNQNIILILQKTYPLDPLRLHNCTVLVWPNGQSLEFVIKDRMSGVRTLKWPSIFSLNKNLYPPCLVSTGPWRGFKSDSMSFKALSQLFELK